MHKREKMILVILNLITLILVSYPIFQGGIIGGYDPGFHMARIQTLASNIASSHFPNPIGFEYLNHFGYGIGFFYGNFFIYPFAWLHLLGVSVYDSYVTYLIVFIILNIVSINYVTQKLFHNVWATILSAPIYLSSYYVIGIIYFRAAAGELIALAIVPWIILFLYRIFQRQTKYWPLLAISACLLLVTHILSFLIIVNTALLLCLFNLKTILKNKNILFSLLKSAALFLGLGSSFIFSFVQQYLAQPYTDTAKIPDGRYSILVIANLMHHNFDTKQFIAINGTFLTILLLLAAVYYLIRWITKPYLNDFFVPQAFLIIVLYSSLILSPTLLGIAVHAFKPLALLQVITRVNIVILPLLTLLVANALGKIITNFPKVQIPFVSVFTLMIIVITITFPIKANLKTTSANKKPIVPYSTSMSEYEPKKFNEYNSANNLQVNTAFLEQKEQYQVTKNNHQRLLVSIQNNHGSRLIMLPRTYYKGYQIKLTSSDQTQLLPTLTEHGLVAAKLPKSFKNGSLEVTYRTTLFAKIGWLITILSLLFLGKIALKRDTE